MTAETTGRGTGRQSRGELVDEEDAGADAVVALAVILSRLCSSRPWACQT